MAAGYLTVHVAVPRNLLDSLWRFLSLPYLFAGGIREHCSPMHDVQCSNSCEFGNNMYLNAYIGILCFGHDNLTRTFASSLPM